MATPLVRQGPCGPVVLGAPYPKRGTAIQFNNIMTNVTTGTILTTDREVKTDMSAAAGVGASLRARLIAPLPESMCWVDCDLDILFNAAFISQDLTSSIEVSFNNGTAWTKIGGCTMAIPSTINPTPNGTTVRTHFKISSPALELNAVAGFVSGADVLSRVLLSRSSTTGVATVVADSAGQSIRLGITELYYSLS